MALTNDQKNGTLALKEKKNMSRTVLTKTKEELKEFVDSEEIYSVKELRSYLGLSQVNFGKRYDIPKRTVESWDMGARECPVWVLKLLNRVVKEDVKSNLRYNRI